MRRLSEDGSEDEKERLAKEGMSAFALQDGDVYHTYSTYARGVETLTGPTSSSTSPRGAGTRTGSSSARRGGAATTSTTTPAG
jgi:hypothetical protein